MDGGPGFTGALITPYYDSLLVKVTSKARSHGDACKKLIRTLNEMRIRGVKTNIPFLLNVLAHPVFLAGRHNTSFIEKYSAELFDLSKQAQADEATKLRSYLANVAVNGPQTPLGTSIAPLRVKPPVPVFVETPPEQKPKTLRQVFLERGPKAFAKAVRARNVSMSVTAWGFYPPCCLLPLLLDLVSLITMFLSSCHFFLFSSFLSFFCFGFLLVRA